MPRPREGSVTWNKKRKAWVARLDWTDVDGKKHCRKRQVEGKSVGNNLVKKWIRETEEKTAAYLDAERMTFKQLAEKYRDTILIEPEYREGKKVKGLRSWKNRRFRLKHLIEYFGHRRLRAITHADLAEYKNQRLATPAKITGKERGITDVQRAWAIAIPTCNLIDLCAYCSRVLRYGTEDKRRELVERLTFSERRAAA